MSRLINYINDYIHTATGERKRVWFRAASNLSRTITGAPAWDITNTSTATWYKRLPNGFVKSQSTSDFGYDKLPLGLFDPPTKTLRLDVALCFDTTDTDVQAVAGYIREGVGASIPLTRWPADPTRLVESQNLFVILTDRGDASIGIGSFAVEFFGVQSRRLEEDIAATVIDGVVSECIYEVELLDFWRAAFAQLTPEDLYLHIVNQPTPYPDTVDTYMFDEAYLHSGQSTWYLHAFGTAALEFHSYPVQYVWQGISALATEILRGQTGLSTPDLVWDVPPGFPDTIGPLAMMRLYMPDYAPTQGHQSVGDITDLAEFVGTIQPAGGGTVVGGWLYPGEEDGMARYDTLWDALKDEVESKMARAYMDVAQSGATTITFEPASRKVRTLTPTEQAGAGKIKPTVRKGVIARASADVPGANSEPVNRVEVVAWGTSEDPRRPLYSGWWQTAPQLGDSGDATLGLTTTATSIFGGLLTTKSVVASTDTMNINTLVKHEQPSGFTAPALFRFHHYCPIRTNDATDLDIQTIDSPGTLPTPDPAGFPGGATDPWIIANWWSPYRLLMIPAQRQGGLNYAAVAWCASLFSKWTQYGQSFTCPASQVLPSDLGSIADIAPGVVLGGVNLLGTVSDPWIVSGHTDDKTGMVECQCIGAET